MNWTDFFIKRPVFSISLAALLVFAGIFGYAHLSLRLYPKIEVPVINISVDYPGADSKTIEGSITNTIENALTGLDGVNYITSSSQQGHVSIDVHMNVGANADMALTNIMQEVASVRDQLPQDIDTPVISKKQSDNSPVLLFGFTSKTLSPPQISDYLNRAVKPQLEAINGVASAQVAGVQYAMRLWLNPKAMAAYGLTTQDVLNSLHSQNVQSTAGSIDGQTQKVITLNSELHNANAFNQLVIKRSGNSVIRLSDIGKTSLGADTNKISVIYNGTPAVMIFVKSQSGANPLQIVNNIDKILPGIKQQLPAGLKLHTVINSATYIKSSIKEVVKTILEAIAVVTIVVFIFLGSVRTLLIPLVTIPLSLAGIGFFLMLAGFSINSLTLLAMVIAIGLVVDDTIVVMENIHRYIEQGCSVVKAALVGTREVAFSIIVMTLTLAAIFAPIAFSGGITGKLFAEFALTLAGMVMLSGIVALTLSPMMCSRIMVDAQSESRLTHLSEKGFNVLKSVYLFCLKKVFQYKKWVLTVWLVSLGACVYFYHTTPQELAPDEDQGFLQVISTAPDSSSTQFLVDNTAKLDEIYHSLSQVQSSIYLNGIPGQHQALSFVSLVPQKDRKLSSMALQPVLQGRISQVPGLQSVAFLPSSLPGTDGLPVQFVIKSTGNYKSLYGAAETLIQAARESGLFLFVTDDLKYDQPALKIGIDRKAATAMGVSVSDIVQTLSVALNENKVQYFDLSGRSYKVIPQIYASDRVNPEQLTQLHVRAQNNKLVPLSALVTLNTVTQPEALNQFQKFNSVTISGVMALGHSLSEGLAFLSGTAKKLLPETMHTDYSGNSRQFLQEGNHMLWLFLSAFIVIFIILSMQFESFRNPLIILLGSLPMALMAAMLPLKFGFATINIYTQIGLLTLAGLVCKHGILLTKFANNRQLEGTGKYEAILQAASTRLRPVLMTTLATVFGVFPLVFASGAGANSRFDMGIVIVVGMFFGTIFTLFVVPVLYHYLSGRHVIKERSDG